jgi:hypothetical protein
MCAPDRTKWHENYDQAFSWVADMGSGLIDRQPIATGLLLRFPRAAPEI